MNEYIPVNTPLLNGNEKRYLNECIDTNWISSEGPFVKKLEEQFAEKVGRKFGIAVCNGSVAIELALKSMGIKENDEIILPTFTIISCALAVVRLGAKPILVDSDPITWNMDVGKIEAKITENTKAIMVVHIYGLPVIMSPIIALAKKYGLTILEDAAQMHGQFYENRPCGSFGEMSTFSFYPNKLVTTGEGGIVVTDSEELFEKGKILRNLGFHPQRRFYSEDLAWNFRLSNLQAAVGVAQLERWDEFVAKKKRIGQCYQDLLSTIPEIQLPLAQTHYAQNIYWVFGIVLQNQDVTALEVMAMLHEEGIGTRSFFYPIHQQPIFQKMGLFKDGSYPVAERLARQGFYIPSGLGLQDQEMIIVSQKLKSVLKNKALALSC